MPDQPRDLGQDVWHFQSPLWQTNSLAAGADDAVLLCDPAYSPDEIESIREFSERLGAGFSHLGITHADFDHVCGIPYFPHAEVFAGEATAEKLLNGTAAEGLEANGPDWGLAWPTDLRVDRAVREGEFECGPFRVAALDASSHGRDGTAFVLLEQGVLFPGDHVSAVTYPLLGGAIPRVVDANRSLLSALDHYDLRWVVPGHGPPLRPDDARAIAEADLTYLEELMAAAEEAVESELPPGYALLRVFAVEPPRANPDDFEIYSIRAGNARLALAQAGLAT